MELSMKTQTLLLVTGKLRVVSQPCSSKIRTIQEVSQSVSGISIMRNSIVLKGLLAAAAAAAAAAVPLLCHAESNVQTGAATSAPGATAHVDFQITIPKILYLRVGTGSSYTTGVLSSVGTVDLISFAPTAAQVGDRKSTRLNSSHVSISYAVFCLKKKIKKSMNILLQFAIFY